MPHLRLLLLLALGAPLPALAGLQLAPLFQDKAVLQCDGAVPIWGVAGAGEHVSVTFAGQKVGATAGPDGRWIAVLAPLNATPLGSDLVVVGKSTVTAHDVVVGEVWLCSGGSGMEVPAPADPGARYPLIRQFRVGHQAAAVPLEAASGDWKACTPETVGQFSALGYFFAHDLFARLGVPFGIITSASPDSSLEMWMSPASLSAFRGLRRQPGLAAAAPGEAPGPAGLFNGMIHPLLPYAIRGAIWCQGEGDLGRSADYAAGFPALIAGWRSHFGEGDFPFLWVQLAGPGSARGSEDAWARLREAQSSALPLSATGQAVAIDVGDSGSREVARRLVLIAKAIVYSVPVDFLGPTYTGISVEGAAIRVHFNFAGEGLTASGKPLQSFEIAGADRVFHAARATIDKDSVVVLSSAVKQPVAVRYGWRHAAEGNLYNGSGLPAPPFRSDDW